MSNSFLAEVRVKGRRRRYGLAVDPELTLVVGRRHVEAAAALVPAWWGVKVATVGRRGGISFADLRRARRNPVIDPLAVAKLLWRDEALSFLVELGKEAGVRSKARAFVYERLTQVVALEGIRDRVCRQMGCREKWLIPLFRLGHSV